MKKTPLKRTSKIQNIKLRIQALLRAILLQKGAICAFDSYQGESVRCAGVLQCDHKFSRSHNSTFADFSNLHLLCKAHNRWKHYYGEEARGFMDEIYGKRKMATLQKKAHKSYPMSKNEWLQKEAELKLKLAELER